MFLIGRKQSFDLNVQHCRGLVLLELEIRAGGKGHFQFATLIDRSRLLHEENLLSLRILLDQIVTKDLFDERFHHSMAHFHRMVRGDFHEHRSTLRTQLKRNETIDFSVG